VYDLTYGPGESRLISEARQSGFVTIDGLPMLVAQAEQQFKWWTGTAPAAGVMRDAAYSRVLTPAGPAPRAAANETQGASL
jgi:shikimate 5-dehydrogenase